MYITPLFFPNLLKIQRESFIKFLEYGIKREIEELNLLQNQNRLKKNTIYFYTSYYQLNLPRYTSNECIILSKTFNSELIIPVKLKTKHIQTKWVVLTNIPIMTNKCHFITNGSPRIIMSQITRAPGVYYHKEVNKPQIKSFKEIEGNYYADIIAERGNWLRIEIDTKNNIWMKLKKMQKIPALLFLKSLGIRQKTLLKFFTFPLINQQNSTNEIDSQQHAKKNIENISNLDFLRNNWNKTKIPLQERFLNKNFYSLGDKGRLQINNKFKVLRGTEKLTLTPVDFLIIIDFLIKTKFKIEEIDDIDNLKNKRVKIVGELVQTQLTIGVLRFYKSIKEKLVNSSINQNIEQFFSSNLINSTIGEFFGTNPLSQFMDEVNPLSSLTHKRRISSLGSGGVSRDTATMTIRSIHPTLYGRVCPIETPEGKNAGLVNSFAMFSNIYNEGSLQTPLFRVCNGQVLFEMGVHYIPADQEDKSNIIPYDVKKSRIGFLSKYKLPSRVKGQLQEIKFTDIDFISISSIQMLSIATSLIPFMEHDDANRVLMGSNMQRQAVPLIKSECCLVGTGLESKIFNDLEDNIKAVSSGLINFVSSKHVMVYSSINQYKKFNIKKDTNIIKCSPTPFSFQTNFQPLKILKYKHLTLSIKNRKMIKFENYQSIIKSQKVNYLIKEYNSSNQGTCTTNRITVNEGQWLLNTNSLLNGFSCYNNELSLGKNLFVGYISWKGYNFEDAVVLSRSLVTKNVYTSTHIEKFETEIKENNKNNEILTRNLRDVSFSKRKKLTSNGIIRIGSMVYSGDILVGKLMPVEKNTSSPYRKLLYEILKKQSQNYRNTSLRVPKYKRGRITSVDHKYFNLQQSPKLDVISNNTQLIKIHLMQNRLIQVGDKISGRHGNKGIISKIVEEYNMPYLIDGTPLDIILNPLGVPSRMNIGQVLECLLGLSSFYINKRFKVLPFDESFGFESSRNLIYSKLYFCRIKTGNQWLLNLRHPGKNTITDSVSGLEFDQPITVGKAYILKLIHLVEEKVHARSTGSYSLVTQQPLKGKSKKGGQRIGEMEVWALEGYGASYILHEILTIKSDDIKSRQKVISSILNNKTIKFGTTETFKVLIRELQSLCLNFKFFTKKY